MQKLILAIMFIGLTACSSVNKVELQEGYDNIDKNFLLVAQRLRDLATVHNELVNRVETIEKKVGIKYVPSPTPTPAPAKTKVQL